MIALLEGFKALGLARLITMGVVAAAMLSMLAFLALHGGSGEQMGLLYADLDVREAGQIADALDRARIRHDVSADGTRLSVPGSDVSRARLLLAKEGLPSGGSIGYEIFDRSDNLTASQFQQSINQTRALEGELSRSIRMLIGVRAARVHLVLPKREPFSRTPAEAQASVVLTTSGPGRMDREGVQSVLTLVAAAVPGLRPQNIGIVDSRGNLLAKAGQQDDGAVAAEQVRAATEQRLSHAVEQMLEQTVGTGHVHAETAVEMDYDQVHETAERYDPEGKVERSTQSNSSSNRTTEANGTVSVANNLPNADAGATPAGSQEQRTEETTNYEIGKTVRTLVRDQPQLRRISLAVMVDQVPVKGADGATTWHDRPADELSRIASLSRTAVGFDEKRGDHVDVVSLRFAETADAPAPPKPGLFGLTFEKSDLFHIGQMATLAVVSVLALLFVIRPMALRLTQVSGGSPGAVGAIGVAGVDGTEAAVAGAAAMAALAGGPPPGQLAIAGPAGSLPDDSMVNIGNIEGAMRASSLRQVAALVQRHPEESLAVMRSWMASEED